MRSEKGKLICIWSPVLHGEGGSAIACLVGFGIQNCSGRRVLIVNKGGPLNRMEEYVENDIGIKYSMDNLRIFNKGIRAEHILAYATQLNKGLYMIAGSKVKIGAAGENDGFEELFIDRCLDCFDVVIADIDTGTRKENSLYLERADIIIAVFTPNEIVIDELYQDQGMKDALGYFTGKKTIRIINKLYDGWEQGGVLGRYKGMYSLADVFGLNYDGDILNACCKERNLYSFTVKNIMSKKNTYTRQLKEICGFLSKRLNIESKKGGAKHEGILGRFAGASFYHRGQKHGIR